MKNSNKNRFSRSMRLVAAAAVAVLSLCGSPRANAQDEKFEYLFQEAVRQKQMRNLDVAFDLYEYCLKLDPESSATMYELARLYSTMKNDKKAIEYLERACELSPNNYWYKDNLVKLYFKENRSEEALVVVEDMAHRFPQKTEVLMMLLGLYEKNRDYENMVKVLDKIETKEGKSEQLSMNKFQIFVRMGEEEKAFKEIEELAKEYPNDLRYQVVKADLYYDAEKKEEAMKLYKEIEQKDSRNITLLLSLVSYYQNEGPESKYQEYLTKLVTHPQLDETTRVRMLTGLMYENLGHSAKDSTMILNLFDEALKLPQETTELLELRVKYMVVKKMPDAEIKPYLYQILKIDPESDMARQQLMQYAINANDAQGIVDICKPAVEYNSSNPIYYFYLGMGYVQLKSNKEAVNALRMCIDRVEDDADNKTALLFNSYSMLGELYHQMGQDDKAYEAYDSCLIYKPNDAMVLNNYAYYLSLNKKDLEKAEEMSRKANELDPDNATYLDTYAWVLFQMKRYDEAKKYMDKVVELISPDELASDSDIRDHIEQINKKVGK